MEQSVVDERDGDTRASAPFEGGLPQRSEVRLGGDVGYHPRLLRARRGGDGVVIGRIAVGRDHELIPERAVDPRPLARSDRLGDGIAFADPRERVAVRLGQAITDRPIDRRDAVGLHQRPVGSPDEAVEPVETRELLVLSCQISLARRSVPRRLEGRGERLGEIDRSFVEPPRAGGTRTEDAVFAERNQDVTPER